MKKILTIAILLFSMASYAQGNLQFNQVLTYTGNVAGSSNGPASSPILYTVPSGKVCKIEAMGICGGASGIYLNINSIDYINQITIGCGSGSTIHETIWLKAGDIIKYTNNNGISKSYILSMIEYNIVP